MCWETFCSVGNFCKDSHHGLSNGLGGGEEKYAYTNKCPPYCHPHHPFSLFIFHYLSYYYVYTYLQLLCLNFLPFMSWNQISTKTKISFALNVPSSQRVRLLAALVLFSQLSWCLLIEETRRMIRAANREFKSIEDILLYSFFRWCCRPVSCLISAKSKHRHWAAAMTGSERNKKSPSLQRGRPSSSGHANRNFFSCREDTEARGRKVKRSQWKFPLVILINKLVIGLA